MRLALILLLVSIAALPAAEPAWVGAVDASQVPGFPGNRWLVGLGQDVVAGGEVEAACRRAVDQARCDLARSIRVRVVATDHHEALSERTAATGLPRSGANERFHEVYAQSSTTTSDVELTGLRTEVARRGDQVFALAAVERAVLGTAAAARAADRLAAAEAAAATARQLAQAGRSGEAHDAWAAVAPALTAAGEEAALLRALGLTPAADAARCALHAEMGAALARLTARPVAGLDDLADVVVRRLGAQSRERPALLVTPLTLRATRVPSPFGRAAAQRLTAALGRLPWPVVVAEAGAGPARDRARQAGAGAVLLGSVWPQADGSAQVVVEVVALADGVRLAVGEAAIPAAGIAASGEALAPENAAQALADQQAFAASEVLSRGLTLELWTTKGDDAQVFTAGETMRVFVRVDRPCHLRLVYHLATGERTLLLDDRFLDEGKVNRVYELPEAFTCAAPFGAETLQANASSAPFAPLATVAREGYLLIRDDLPTQLATTRGFTIARHQPVQIAEARVVITTVKP